MNQLRNTLPIILAGGIGVGIGVYTFDPVFKELQEEKNKEATKGLDSPHHTEEVEILKSAEARASRSASTESTLQANAPSKSWWPSLGLWATAHDGKPSPKEPKEARSKDGK